MGQQAIPLQCGQGKTRFLHVVEHLGEKPEIIGRGSEAEHPADTPDGQKYKEKNCHPGNCLRISRFLQRRSGQRLFLVPEPGIDSHQYSHQHTRKQERPGKCREKAYNCQNTEGTGHTPAGKGDQTKHCSQRQNPNRGHRFQSFQSGKPPQMGRQQQIFGGDCDQPGCQKVVVPMLLHRPHPLLPVSRSRQFPIPIHRKKMGRVTHRKSIGYHFGATAL